MYTLNSLLLLGVIVAVTMYWFESRRVHEIVIRVCRELCEQSGLQLLDQTVALSSISLARPLAGRWQVRRVYQFEVSNNGIDRYKGYIMLLSATIEAIQIDNADGMTTIYPALPGQIH